jgi:hypothetical protein
MKKIQIMWYMPLLVFAFAAALIYEAVQIIIDGKFGWRWTDASDRIFVQPDTSPVAFWCVVSVLFIFGAAVAVGGVFLLRAYLRLRGADRPKSSHMIIEQPNPFQSEQFREVRKHLTDAEKRSFGRLVGRFGIWMLFLGSIGPTTAALHGSLQVVLVIIWFILFLGSGIWMMSSLSKFYCSTDWGRQRGYSHKTFRFFSFPNRKA